MPAEIEAAEIANTAAWWDTEGKHVHDGLMTADYVREHPAINWTVSLVPIEFPPGTETGDYLLVRDTDDRRLNCVTGRYQPMQNHELLQFMCDLVDTDELMFESVLSLKGGEIVALCARTPDHITIAGEQNLPYFTGANWHNSNRKMMVNFSVVRVVCRNTLNASIGNAPNVYYFKHTGRMEERLTEAREALQMGFKYTEELRKIGEGLAAKKITGAELDRFLKWVVPSPQKKQRKRSDLTGLTEVLQLSEDQYNKAVAKVIRTREGIKAVYSDTPDLENIRGTRWGALQAVTYWNDHTRRFESPANRFETVVLSRSDYTERALEYLTKS